MPKTKTIGLTAAEIKLCDAALELLDIMMQRKGGSGHDLDRLRGKLAQMRPQRMPDADILTEATLNVLCRR
jgi:hypothetical protein